MHFVILSVNRDSADLFIGDKSALAQMSCVDTQARARIDTHTRSAMHPLCAALWEATPHAETCTPPSPLCVYALFFISCCTLLLDFIVHVG